MESVVDNENRESLEQQIERERVRLLYKQAKMGYLFSLTAQALLCALLVGIIPAWQLWAWWGLGFAVIVARFWLINLYDRSDTKEAQFNRWEFLYTFGSLVSGMVWGLGGFVFLSQTDLYQQALILLLVAGMVAGAVPFLAWSWWAFLGYFVGSLFPLAIWFAFQWTTDYAALGSLTALYMVGMWLSGKRFGAILRDSLRLQITNSRISTDLEEANENLREDIDRRIQTEETMRRRAEFQRIITTLSTDFIGLSAKDVEQQIDSEIERALFTLGNFTDVDRAYVFLFSDDQRNVISISHEWCAEGVVSRREDLSEFELDKELPWISRQIRQLKEVYLSDLDQLPAEAVRERRNCQNLGVQSMLLVPMVAAGAVRGFLGFDSVRTTKSWGDDAISMLRMVAEIFSNALDRKHAQTKIWHQAYFDPLTDLPNRRLLFDRLERDLSRARRHGHLGAVLYLDLDHFKTINDSLGHPVGDKLLCQIADRFSASLRREDTAARIGGDEFVVLLSEVGSDPERSADMTQSVAEKLHAVLVQPYYTEGHELHITVSIGVNVFPGEANDAADVLKQADAALYRAKESGRNAIKFFVPTMQEDAEMRLRMQNNLRAALKRNEFEIYYQPQIHSDKGLIGAEALIRWIPEESRPISPGEFIPIAEETGLIMDIGEWVLETVCERYKNWIERKMVPVDSQVSVNVSPRQFHNPNFEHQVRDILTRTGIDPARVQLECTEGTIIQDIDDVVRKMEAIRQLGVHFSVDDFGTGYSSLLYLKRLPLDTLKIDRAFVQGITHDQQDAAIANTIITMGRLLGLKVIAEGVETVEELNYLKENGCTVYQGFYFSRPLTESQFESLLEDDEKAESSAEDSPNVIRVHPKST